MEELTTSESGLSKDVLNKTTSSALYKTNKYLRFIC